MQWAGAFLGMLFLAVAAGAIRAGSEPAHKDKTALLSKPVMLNHKPGAVVTKLRPNRVARSLAHMKAVRMEHETIQELVTALNSKSKSKSPEFLANETCAKQVEGTIAHLEYGYTDLQVSEFLSMACDSYKVYLNFGGPETCQVIFQKLDHEYRYDRQWAKWCAESAALMAAGPAGAPGPAPLAAPAMGPGGGWHAPWLAATGIEGPSPDFFATCESVVDFLTHRSSRGEAMGKPAKMDEYLTIVCSVPRSTGDEELCNDFKKTFLEHIHPRDKNWNVDTMDVKLFCNGFYKVLVQHVGFYHAMAKAGPSSAPGPGPMPAPAPAPPPANIVMAPAPPVPAL